MRTTDNKMAEGEAEAAQRVARYAETLEVDGEHWKAVVGATSGRKTGSANESGPEHFLVERRDGGSQQCHTMAPLP